MSRGSSDETSTVCPSRSAGEGTRLPGSATAAAVAGEGGPVWDRQLGGGGAGGPVQTHRSSGMREA